MGVILVVDKATINMPEIVYREFTKNYTIEKSELILFFGIDDAEEHYLSFDGINYFTYNLGEESIGVKFCEATKYGIVMGKRIAQLITKIGQAKPVDMSKRIASGIKVLAACAVRDESHILTEQEAAS